MLDIRPIQTEDLSLLSEYWYDNIVLQQQSNPRIHLLPDARCQWERYTATLIQNEAAICLVAVVKADVLGCIAGTVSTNQPGLAPEMIGVIEWLILDLHATNSQHQSASALLNELKVRFATRGISQLQVRVAAQATVAQAFWRGIGAKKIDDIFWIDE
jgi:hypothetical protein